MTVFIEGSLVFQFDPLFDVRKYDGHEDYRQISHAGLKAVDFLAVWRIVEVVIMEVKDFKNRRPDQRISILKKIFLGCENWVVQVPPG